MGFQPATKFGKYLGFPITQGKIKDQELQFILNNVKNKLSGWKTKFLNLASRMTLAKSCVNSIPSTLHRLPTSITNKIDQIQKNFIWGTTENKPVELVGSYGKKRSRGFGIAKKQDKKQCSSS